MMLRNLLTLFCALLTSTTVACVAASQVGLVGQWTFDDPAAPTRDLVSGRAGSVHGALQQPGKLGRCMSFSSARDDYLDLGASVQLTGNQATLVAVVRVRQFADISRGEANSRNGIFGSDDRNIFLAVTDLGRVIFGWDAGQLPDHDYQQITTRPADSLAAGRWYHVAVTRDGATMTLYVDGVVRTARSGYSDRPFPHLDRSCIGRVNGTPNRDFDGWIDDLRVYDRALSPQEIWQLAESAGLAQRQLPEPGQLQRVAYRNPGLVVDLSVGLYAWPMPLDYEGDGDLDLLVACSDVPYDRVCLFENPGHGSAARRDPMPVFRPARVVGPGGTNLRSCDVDGRPRILGPGVEYIDVPRHGFTRPQPIPLPVNVHPNKVRANQWTYCDYDDDGRLDILIGVGDWTDYGWDDAFDDRGRWTRGPLHGYVYLARNAGSSEHPDYESPVQLTAEAKPIDVFGMPTPNLADFDGDGDLDLLCGEFVDKFTYFQNVGTRAQPRFAAGRHLVHAGGPIHVDSCMFVPTAIDWDGDGDVDLVVGQVDGRVMFVENTGHVEDGLPVFQPPRYFQQEADDVKFGALATPVSVDWDRDGDEDIICGNSAGYIGFIENLDGACPPRWARPRLLESEGQTIRIMAGENGSIQGPCERKWGYTTLSVCDWDHDGLLDLVVNSIWGQVVWYRNVGSAQTPQLGASAPIEVQWPAATPKPQWNWWEPRGNELVTQWRTTPAVIDWNQDGLNDLVMLDTDGYLSLYARVRDASQLRLLPPQRVFVGRDFAAYDRAHRVSPTSTPGGLLRLNADRAGQSGRRKFCFTDWDGDGSLDLLVNSRNVNWLQNAGTREGRTIFADQGPLDTRALAGHTSSPTVVDWNRDGVPDLLVGAEDGFLYYLENARGK